MTSLVPSRHLPRDVHRDQPLAQVLVRRRRLRAELVQGLAIIVGVGLGLAMAQLTAGPTVDSSVASQLLVGIAAGIVPFVGLVYSLLFLVVQYGSTNLTPRLNLFRDNPLVWRSFAYYIGLLVWAGTTGLAASGHDRISVAVPITGLIGVLVAVLLFRLLQTKAFASIQLAPTLRDIRDHGRTVIDALYSEPYDTEAAPAPTLPAGAELRWPDPGGVLRQIDLPALVRAAVAIDGVIELTVTPGDTLREDGLIAVIHGGPRDVDDATILAAFDVGLERTFDQDPRFAFRLLADIAIRALSAAINDQATAVQVIDTIDGLLTPLCARRLDIGKIHTTDGTLRVLIPVPTWDDYLDLAVADIARAGATIAPVSQRLLHLLDEVGAAAPPARHPPIDHWRHHLTA